MAFGRKLARAATRVLLDRQEAVNLAIAGGAPVPMVDIPDAGTSIPTPMPPSFPGGTQLGIDVGGTIGGVDLSFPIPGTEGIPGTISLTGAGGGGGAPGDFSPIAAGCLPGFTRDPITGQCRFDIDPGPGTGLPGGNGRVNLTRPMETSRRVLVCPKFADGRMGILWMNMLDGQIVCLPRGVSGKGFGMVRKNRPRAKPFISAAEIKAARKRDSLGKKAKTVAGLTGQTCKRR